MKNKSAKPLPPGMWVYVSPCGNHICFYNHDSPLIIVEEGLVDRIREEIHTWGIIGKY